MDPGDSSVHSGKNLSPGGENQSANHWAVRTIVKKGEDRFLVCEDLRALFLDDDTKELLVLLMPKPGAITATFTVFDGVDNPRAVFANRGGWNT